MHEDERLLIGGRCPLRFDTIRNIAQSENYTQYIKVLTILNTMVKGYSLQSVRPYSDDARCMQEMINSEMANGDQTDDFIPKYIQTMFHHFLLKKTEIVINVLDWNTHFFGYYQHIGMKYYGLKKFAELFAYNDKQRIMDYSLFIKLFTNSRLFLIGNFVIGNAKPSIELSKEFVERMFECIEYLNASSRSLSLSRFEIVKPSSSINEFIKQNRNKFEEKGWKLKRETFSRKGAFENIGSHKMLSIEKIMH